MKTSIIFTSIAFFLLSCIQMSKNKGNGCFDTIESLKSGLININVSEINEFKKCFTINNKEVVDDENSNIKWQRYSFSNRGRILFEAETSWDKKNNIHRIIVLDSSLIYEGDILIGQSFDAFRQKIKYAYWDESYGTFYVKLSKDDNISIELEVKQEDSLMQWESDLSKIPNDIKVKSIIINTK